MKQPTQDDHKVYLVQRWMHPTKIHETNLNFSVSVYILYSERFLKINSKFWLTYSTEQTVSLNICSKLKHLPKVAFACLASAQGFKPKLIMIWFRSATSEQVPQQCKLQTGQETEIINLRVSSSEGNRRCWNPHEKDEVSQGLHHTELEKVLLHAQVCYVKENADSFSPPHMICKGTHLVLSNKSAHCCRIA